MCCCTNKEPFNFVTVEGRATVEKDNLVALTRKVFANIADSGWTEPEDLQGWLDKQDRVILRIHPEKVYGVIR